MNSEDRIKVKEYSYERTALLDFLDKSANRFSVHVKDAVWKRLGVIERELKHLDPQKKQTV